MPFDDDPLDDGQILALYHGLTPKMRRTIRRVLLVFADARAARTSVFYATGLIGFFYLMTFVLGFGAMVLVGPDAIRAVDPGGNMAARRSVLEAIGLWDERLSTAAVERDLIAADMSRARRAEVIDQHAAAFILQGALDRLARLRPGP